MSRALVAARALVPACALVAACGNGSVASVQDAGDAAVTTRFPPCSDPTASDPVVVRGTLGEVDEACKGSVPSDYAISWLGHDAVSTTTTLLSTFRLGGLPNQELALRITRTGSVPRIKPIHPWGCLFPMGAFVLPTPAATDAILAPIGGFDATKAYLLVFAEGKGDPSQQSICIGNVAGFTVSSSRGAVHYLDASGAKLDATATATSAAGTALIVVDAAPALGADPDVVRVTAKRAGATPSCRIDVGQGWDRGDPTSQTEFVADAPAIAGHFTYALFVSCF